MGNRNIAFDVDNETLYVSSRIFSFILENINKVDSSIDLSEFQKTLESAEIENSDNNGQIEVSELIQLFQLCRSSNLGNGDFYMIGNKVHEIHFSLISLLFRFDLDFTLPIKNEIGFIKISFDFQEDVLKLNVEIPKHLILDAKEVIVPILKWIHGFIDRFFQIYLTNKPRAFYRVDSIEFTYSQIFVSNFDIARYVSNEQFFFSRLKHYVYKVKDEGETNNPIEKVEFYLFKDIGFSIEEIASKMELSVRSLQRNLKEGDMSFRAIKENVRRVLSEKYLSDLSLNIQEISELLAYSERSAFERAFKKWFGQNPKDFRMNLDQNL